MIEHKKKNREETATGMTTTTPIANVWEALRRMRGRPPRRITILEDGGVTYRTNKGISNKLATTFAGISSSNNFTRTFREVKERRECERIEFDTNKKETYNEPFTKAEIEDAISKLNSTAPGPDDVSNSMIKRLPDNAKQYLLLILNNCFSSSFFPERWKKSIIVSIPKPNKDHTNSRNYRPIALTSVLCKVLER